MDKKADFMKGNSFGLLVLDLLIGSGASAIPSGSLFIFLINMLITIIGLSISRYWWKTVPGTVRYNSLVTFVMLISMGFFTVTPLLRITNDTLLFWPVLLLYLLVLGYSLFKKELIFQAFHRPEGSRIAFGTFVFLFVLIIIGAFSFRNGQELLIMNMLNDHQGAFFISLMLFGIGLLVSFISSAMLKRPEDIKS
ncbi:hypothetical protein CVD28_23985 [Bacillus sp. M6-12]|uniref:hypothetical protein n=1 Tax=Bacillus sp. M6-12 TaxID=2054166 RepID=UPI000C763CF9|nr:hypothetical protein [Bacillus sp. M6-12]PLS15385.1 hypothetical protein CVD28_23985 [Bacillus sp. M6-12]